MRLVLDLTREQAVSLHDLVTDADMHGGRVVYPVPLPEGMGAIADAIEELVDTSDNPWALPPSEAVTWGMAAGMIADGIPASSIANALRALVVMS